MDCSGREQQSFYSLIYRAGVIYDNIRSAGMEPQLSGGDVSQLSANSWGTGLCHGSPLSFLPGRPDSWGVLCGLFFLLSFLFANVNKNPIEFIWEQKPRAQKSDVARRTESLHRCVRAFPNPEQLGETRLALCQTQGHVVPCKTRSREESKGGRCSPAPCRCRSVREDELHDIAGAFPSTPASGNR